MSRPRLLMGAMITMLVCASALFSQQTPGRGQQGPRIVSPEILSDKKVIFRLLAPKAVNLEIKRHIDLYLSGALSGCNLSKSRNTNHRRGISPAHYVKGIDKISAQTEIDLLANRKDL
jgi:hypothetical protein